MTPWLQGEPTATHHLISSEAHPVVYLLKLRCGAEFETERGHFVQARQMLDRSRSLDDSHLYRRREAKFLAAIGDFAGAEKTALDGQRWNGLEVKKVKADHPLSLNALGEVYAARGLHKMAVQFFERSMAFSRGKSDMRAEWAEARTLVAFSHLALGDSTRALADAEEALSFSRQQWGEMSPRSFDAADALGVVLTARGKLEEAEQWTTLALLRRQALYEHAHPKTAASYIHYAQWMVAQGPNDKAIEWASAGVRIMQAALPDTNARKSLFLVEVADIYERAGRHAEAREFLELAVGPLAAQLGEVPSVQACSRRIAEMQRTSGDQ